MRTGLDSINDNVSGNHECVTSGPIGSGEERSHNPCHLTPAQRIRLGIKEIATRHGVDPQQIYSRNRQAHIVRARGDAILWVLTTYPHMSFPQVGRIFKRDHTTIMHHAAKAGLPLRTIRKLEKRYSEFAQSMAQAGGNNQPEHDNVQPV